MGREQRTRPVQIRFSPYSFLGLLLCWLLFSALAFYGGTIVGRMAEVRDSIQRASRAEKIAPKEDEIPLFFSEVLSGVEPPEAGFAGETPTRGAAPAPDRGSKKQPGSDSESAQLEPDSPAALPAMGSAGTGSLVEEKVLQIGAFRELERADRLAEGLKGKGYPAWVVSSGPPGSNPTHRVYVGPFQDSGSAARARELLESREGVRGVLLLSRPDGRKQP